MTEGDSGRAHVSLSQGRLPALEPQLTALIVIDLQNDFCSPRGALALRGSDVGPCAAVAERIADALPRLRGVVGTVAFFRLVYDPAEMSSAQRERLLFEGKPPLCSVEGDGAELFCVAPGPDDFVFIKHRYSAFSVDAFTELLRVRGIETVLVTGVDTHICVEGSVRHGYDLGYRMVVLSDLVGTRAAEEANQSHSLRLCDKYFATVIKSSELLATRSRR